MHKFFAVIYNPTRLIANFNKSLSSLLYVREQEHAEVQKVIPLEGGPNLACSRPEVLFHQTSQLCQLYIQRNEVFFCWFSSSAVPIMDCLVLLSHFSNFFCLPFLCLRCSEQANNLLLCTCTLNFVCFKANEEIQFLALLLEHVEQRQTNAQADVQANFTNLREQ